MNATGLGILLVIISTIFAAIGGFTLKLASGKIKNLKSLIKNKHLILGLVFFAIGVIFYIFGLKYGELNMLYPVSSLTYVWSTLMAKRYLKEKINFYKWLGIGLIILGSFLAVN